MRTTARRREPGRASPRGLKVTRRGSALQVSWKKVSGTAQYSLSAVLSDGRRVLIDTRKTSARITGSRSVKKATVTLYATDANGLEGDSASTRFPAKKAKRKTKR